MPGPALEFKNKMPVFLTSRAVAISFLLLTAMCDCLSTYLSVGHRLWLDGNPLIHGFSWTQLLLLQAVGQAVIIIAFLLAWRKQDAIWPDTQCRFLAFLRYRLKKGFALNFSAANLKREMIYVGLLALWFIACAHLLAAVIAAIPLLGGPSFLDFFRLFGMTRLRMAQGIVTIAIAVGAFLMAHYPLYWSYRIKNQAENK